MFAMACFSVLKLQVGYSSLCYLFSMVSVINNILAIGKKEIDMILKHYLGFINLDDHINQFSKCHFIYVMK